LNIERVEDNESMDFMDEADDKTESLGSLIMESEISEEDVEEEGERTLLLSDEDESDPEDSEDDADEDDAGEGEEDDAAGSSARSGPHALYFESIQKRVVNELKHAQRRAWPTEYKTGNFWIPRPSPFFILQKGLDPSELYKPKVFLWMPHLLIPEKSLKCPCCEADLGIKGFNKKPHARRIVDIDRYLHNHHPVASSQHHTNRILLSFHLKLLLPHVYQISLYCRSMQENYQCS
jgi:hypothetical protein